MADQNYDQTKESKEDQIISKLQNIFLIKSQQSKDKFRKSVMDNEDNKRYLDMLFIEQDSIEQLFVVCNSDSAQISIESPPPTKLKKKGVVILKLTTEQITAQNIQKDLAFMELPKNILEHCYLVYHDILSPITMNPLNQQGWTELVSKDLMEKFNSYIAQIYVMIGLSKGRTLLPLPTHKMNHNDSTPDKDKAHVFEGSIITWTKQIKNVLKLEPEIALKQGNDPGPLTELEFWENKMNNLNSIYDQLQSPEVQSILRFLEDNKSTYTKPFDKLQNDVRHARIEANDNYRYLKTLKNQFQDISEGGKEFIEIHNYFLPIMHKILMIWQRSKFYNTPPRLVVLIREICNAIITKARDFISGPAIFQLIASDETTEACEKLQTTIDICSKFKEAYFEYKNKANGEWKLTTNALFVRLDSFLERCQDISHLTKTIVQFNKLQKIELGGTKGKTLSETVELIYQEFLEAVESFQAVKYDIMDIDVKEFDDDFYEFRSKIKELERRLASVITQGFDDQDTIYGRFKLLDSFEGLLIRPIIQDELEKKHIVLLESYKTDLKVVQQIFLEGKVLIDSMDEKAPIFNNLPPIAGALTWCYGLQERIKEPLDKLSQLGQVIIDREEYKDVQKLYTSITKSIKEYEQAKKLAWEKEIQQNSQEKLKQSLLYKNESGTLKVNFDPALKRLLREVKYFQLLGIEVPEMAAEIFEKNETFRDQTIQLDLIVNNYNEIISTLHPVEEPLVKEKIEKIDECLKPGLEELKWKSPNINDFIKDVKVVVDTTYEIVQKMKDSLQKIRQCLDNINQTILYRKTSRPMPSDEFDQIHKSMYMNKVQGIKENGVMIHKLLKEVHDAVKIDRKSPMWMAYLQYVNEIVLEGVSRAIGTALKHMNEQICPINIKRNELPPLFEIRLELGDNDVVYDPIVEEVANHNVSSIRNIVRGWIQDFYYIAHIITRLDRTDQSDYLQEVRDFFELREIMAQVHDNLDWLEKKTNDFKEKFREYKDFWLNDPEEHFQLFLEENEPADMMEEAESPTKIGPEIGGGAHTLSADQNPLLANARSKVPNMDFFDEKILYLKNIQQKIQGITDSDDIGWLKISITPLKNKLDMKVTQWIKVYTEFLKNQVKICLKNMKEFIASTNEGIKKDLDDEANMNDKQLLMQIMQINSVVKDVEPTVGSVVQRIKDMVQTLKKHQVALQEKGEEDPFQVIDNMHSSFIETNNKVINIKAKILPKQVAEAANIKKQIEQFTKKVQSFREEFLNDAPFSYNEDFKISQIQDSYYVIEKYYNKLIEISKEQQEYSNLEKLFELQKTDYKPLRECLTDLKNLKILWDSIAIVNYFYKNWKQQTWTQIKSDILLDQNKTLQTQLKNLPKEVKAIKAHQNITDKVKNMQIVLPLISSLHSEFMEKRHWQQLMELTGKKFDPSSPQFNLEEVLELQLHKYENLVNEIVEVAQKEAKIEKRLKNIEQQWLKQIFEFEDCEIDEENVTKVFLPLDDMMEMLDEHTMHLMGMKSQGKYVEYFLNQVEDWRSKLHKVDSVVNEWLKVQKNWRTMVNIFLKAEDIKQQLANETNIFREVDKEFRELMDLVSLQPSVIENCNLERLDTLKKMNAAIKFCENSLSDYLEGKKKVFPRFYFLSDQSLLTVLSNGNNAPKVCNFLGDCFDGLKTIVFKDPPPGQEFSKTGIAMLSKDLERIDFNTHFLAEGAVEQYLLHLEFMMREQLYNILENAKQTSELWDSGERPRDEWLKDYNAQLALLTTQIVWTDEVTRAFDDLSSGSENAMKDCKQLIDDRLEALIRQVRQELPPLERAKFINVITIDVHGRDQVHNYIVQKVTEAESFVWASQLKFYFDNKDNDMSTRQNLRFPWEKDKNKNKCIVRIVDWHRFYTFEYVGNSIRLVVAPLTDRCYITLTQALNLTMGGAPAGPAGTGKTETTKDLGRGVGINVVVFNCSEQMTKSTMSQIFMGLAQAGCWGCFDEFNRISPEVLSVVSSQVSCVQDALKERKTKFLFMEEGEIQLQDCVGFFITMNPGYTGRSELPTNLKALFRSCAMVVPDLLLICENMLMSEGFSTAKELSKKFVTLYMLSRELLSKQKHYDWGLRAVKSVLRQAGYIKRDPEAVNTPENDLLMRALRDFNLPKIVTDDVNIFTRLIKDLFPSTDPPRKMNRDLEKACQDVAKNELGMYVDKGFILKCVQLDEILIVRHCVFLIGPAGCGKTTVWKNLMAANNKLGLIGEHDTLNPKAVNNSELLGFYTKTKEWKNGVLSNIMKIQSKCEGKYKEHHVNKWIILDGDIDPQWIESMNTVMDDNKVLTLISNDRIPLSNSMRLIFEISNLKHATPATVSRAGVLFVNDTDIGWQPFTYSWMDRSQEALAKTIDDQVVQSNARIPIDDIGKSIFYRCFQTYIEQNSDLLRLKYVAPINDIAKIQTLCCILDSLLKEEDANIKQQNEDNQKIIYEALFIFAGMWAFGGSIGGGNDDEKDQKEFSTIWRAASKIKFPESGLCYDFYFDVKNLQWQGWLQSVKPYVAPEFGEDINFDKVFVPNLQTTRLQYLIQKHLVMKKPVIFIGNGGTGKTALLKEFLNSTSRDQVTFQTINFNSFTDSSNLQRNIWTLLEKKSGKTYGSATQKTLIYFIDDMNMPYMDPFDTQSPIELLNQIINYGSIFNRDMLEERFYLEDLLFMGCLNPKSGYFIINQRLQRHFSPFTMYTPSQESITQVYGNILQGYLDNFDEKIRILAPKMIDATIHVFNKLLKDTRYSPSAKKFHYMFNLRELSKVTEGIIFSQPNQYKGKPEQMIALWIHEVKRVFEDRLINQDDINVFRGYVKEAMSQKIGDESEVQVKRIMEDSIPDNEPLIFTSFITSHFGGDPSYIPADDMAQVKQVLEEKLNEYNETKTVMNLVLFQQAMQHICRIVRILQFGVGNALLIGVGGSGKQSLAKLSAFILELEMEQLIVTSNFGLNDLRGILQEIYRKVAKPSSPGRIFMLTDGQIKDEKFLIPINDMLSQGWISDLFPKDEVDGLINGLRNEAKGAGINVNVYENLMDYFFQKMRSQLKIILCFSPMGNNFRIKCRKFPGIINSSSMNWFHSWPKEALLGVARRFLAEVDFSNEEIRDGVIGNMTEVHLSIDEANENFLKFERRHNATTPKSFLELIEFYKKVLATKRDFIQNQINNYQQGLNILAVTKSKVEGLQEDLKIKMVEVDKQKTETDALIEKVGQESLIAEDEQAIANEEQAKTDEATAAAEELKAKAEDSLAKAIPALKAAENAVNCLKKSHVTEMKNLSTPPNMVVVTATAVMALMGEKINVADPWKKAVQIMNNVDKFLKSVVGFDGKNIEQSSIDNCNKIIKDPANEPKFNPGFMKSQNEAAMYLCSWLTNIIEYNRIFKEVKPLQETCAAAAAELEVKQQQLAVIKERVRVLNEKVDGLRAKLSEAEAKKQKVEAEANMCMAKLQSAETLVNGLSGENKRWGENVKQLQANTLTIIGDVLLGSAFVSYIGAFTAEFRLNLWANTWLPDIINKKIPITNEINPLKILTSDSEIAKWKNQELPSDQMSLENAAIISNCQRWPLIIDPQLQGSTWIKASLGENLMVINMGNSKYMHHLVNAIQMGKFVLIERVQEELDATLDPLLSRQIKKKGNSYQLELGGDPIDYDINFRLYLMTKLTNPHYRPEVAAQCTIINFIVTESGLEDQLLGNVVKIEKAELEEIKSNLVKQQNEFKVILDQLEAQLLITLNNADPNTILDKKDIIEQLDSTKTRAVEIEEQSIKARETDIQINKSREIYRPVANEGSLLYFLLTKLNVVSPMYQYSLESFYFFFYKAINKTTVQDDTRIEELRKNIRYVIFQWVSRGLFEKDKLILLTLITFRLMQKKVIESNYDPSHMEFLIKGSQKAGSNNPLEWLPNNMWDNIQGLIDLEEFKSFAQNMEKDAPTRFKDWYNESTPETTKLPLDWKKLEAQPFQKLLVLRCLRPDRLTIALSSFIAQTLPDGQSFVDMDQKFSFTDILEQCINDADPVTPIFFILSTGSDPVKEVIKIAKTRRIEVGKQFFQIALGQGMAELAKRRIEEGYKEGHWVMLQNIHLMPSWLKDLEKLLDQMANEGGSGNPQFRLFLSADPDPKVPIGILDKSIKMTQEPPTGLKNNMKKCWNYFSKEEIEDKDPKIKSILFALCYFHCTLIERKRYGPKGWNMSYPFNIGDLRDSYLVLCKQIEGGGGGKVPFEDLIYIFGEIMYGGHITDDLDRILCKSYLYQIMHEQLFDELELFPFIEGKGFSFKVPPANSYEKYIEHIEQSLTKETPLAYGLHPNAEIGFRTTQCNSLFATLLELQPKDNTAAGQGSIKTPTEITQDIIRFILEDKEMKSKIFNIEEVKGKLDDDTRGPYQNVFLQEIEYMNALLIEIVRSLEETDQGFKGLLTITEKMEDLIASISLNRVPASWVKLAYPSKRGLGSWLENLWKRYDQYDQFKEDPINPAKVIMISRLFNPQSYLTAIKQIIAQKNSYELNKLYIATEVQKKSVEEVESAAKDGSYVFGFILEGARWDMALGVLDESRPKEMFNLMPVVYCKALLIPPEGKEDKTLYMCPVFKTEDRGPTYVFTAQLKTRYAPRKWILAGVAILMDVEGVSEELKKK